MAPVHRPRPRRVAGRRRDDEDLLHSGSQSSGEDKIARMAEQLKTDVSTRADLTRIVSKVRLTVLPYRLENAVRNGAPASPTRIRSQPRI